jgi:hypothetical protein
VRDTVREDTVGDRVRDTVRDGKRDAVGDTLRVERHSGRRSENGGKGDTVGDTAREAQWVTTRTLCSTVLVASSTARVQSADSCGGGAPILR